MVALLREYDTCSSLVTANAEAFAGGNFQAAYHAMMALIHLAHDLKDRHVLGYAQRKAAEQAAWLDTYTPHHSAQANYFANAEELAAAVQCDLDQTARPSLHLFEPAM